MVDRNNGVGVISVLEGGYSLSAPKAKKASSTNNAAPIGAVGTRGRTASSGANHPDPPAVGGDTKQPQHLDPHTMFAQQPGDGGLVKGCVKNKIVNYIENIFFIS